MNRSPKTRFVLVVELIPESYVEPLDLEKAFGRSSPLDVDLGCGDGAFLVAMAERYPERNFLGIERMRGRVEKVCRKAAKVSNVRVLRLETSYAIRYLLPQNTVETFYLLFPDPWPKRRHQRRRVATSEFLDAIHRALRRHGALHIATDDRNYFEQIQRVAQSDPRFARLDNSGDDHLPATRFQKRFEERGAPIYRLTLRKISPVM
ncbi:MAG: tRNA (guanosine(46)-N7)-methyltransferase TrmB [Chthoniobacterales bacterium]